MVKVYIEERARGRGQEGYEDRGKPSPYYIRKGLRSELRMLNTNGDHQVKAKFQQGILFASRV